ncbi:hypothetical protein ACFS07_27705 [Undibacterium arcticum]
MAQIEKQFGKGSVMRMDSGAVVDEVQVVSTASLGLDIALGGAAACRAVELRRSLLVVIRGSIRAAAA